MFLIFSAMEIKMNKVMKFLKEEDGASAIEYGLIAGLVAVAIIVALGTLGGNLSTMFDNIAKKLPNGTGGTTPTPPAGGGTS